MKRIGIIAEYNPFHNGHLYQINKAKAQFSDALIIVLLTNYFQSTGEISQMNKYDKTKAAIDNGADIVLEYPYLLATQSADYFAKNAISILNRFGVDIIFSGSEKDDLNLINNISMLEKNNDFQKLINDDIKLGKSYRASFDNTLKAYGLNILESNDMLNLKYYDSIQEINPNIRLELLERTNNYQENSFNESLIQSATSIRNGLKNNLDIKSFIPHNVCLNKYYDINDFTDILKYKIINDDLSNIFQANEGIENSLDTNFKSIDEIIEKLTTRRYRETKIKRFISYIITDYTKNIILEDDFPIRVLGFNGNGRSHLNSVKKVCNITTTIKDNISIYDDFELKLAKIFTVIYKEDFIKIEQKLPYIKE